jgi:hypothetical protein
MIEIWQTDTSLLDNILLEAIGVYKRGAIRADVKTPTTPICGRLTNWNDEERSGIRKLAQLASSLSGVDGR